MTAFNDQMQDDLDIFYNTDEFAEEVDIKSEHGGDVYHDIAVIFEFGEGIRERGSDALGVEATMRIKASDAALCDIHFFRIIDEVFNVYRSNGEIWRVLDAELATDGLEWVCVISRMSR